MDDERDDNQEKGGERVDNRLMVSPAQVTIGNKHIQNTTDITLNKNCDQEKGGEIVDDKVDYDKEKCGYIYDYEGNGDRYKGGDIADN